MKFNKDEATPYDDLFRQASEEHGVPYELLKKVAWIESRYNPKAKSPTGATGIMQFVKATGKSMGLRIDDQVDERNDPAKAINAGARHLADLYKKYEGNEALIGLEYNQGAGKLGRPQLEAFKTGRYNEISSEGRKYIELMTGKPLSNQKTTEGGITPLTKPTEYNYIDPESLRKVKPYENELATMSLLSKESTPTTPYLQFYGADTEDKGAFSGTGEAVKSALINSPIGQLFESTTNPEYNHDFMESASTWDFDDESVKFIKENLKNADYMNVVLSAKNQDEVKSLVKLANDNYERDKTIHGSGWGAQLVAGFAQAGVDPLSYVPIVGSYAKAGNFVKKATSVGLQVGGINVASEAMRTSIAGGEADYKMAFASGMVLGAGFSALGSTYRNFKGVNESTQGAFIRAEARERVNTEGITDPTLYKDLESLKFTKSNTGVEYAPHPTEEGAVVLRDGSVISAFNPINPQTIQEFKQLSMVNKESFDRNLTGKSKVVGGFKKNRQVKGMTLKPKQKLQETSKYSFDTLSPTKEQNQELYIANSGFDLGGVTELSLRPFFSKDNEVLELANSFFRPSTGDTTGGWGKRGATIEDIVSHLNQADNVGYETRDVLFKKAFKEYRQLNKGSNLESSKYNVNRRVAEAIDAISFGDKSKLEALSKTERELAEELRKHFNGKLEDLMDTTRYGNINAKPVLESGRLKDGYIPVVFDKGRKNVYISRYGEEVIEDAYARALLVKYDSNSHIKNQVDAYLKEKHGVDVVTREMVVDDVQKNAFGVIREDKFTTSATVDDQIEGLVGLERNDYLEHRQLYGYDGKVTLPDGSEFSPNDLRNFDLQVVTSKYNRRVNGDIAIMGATGKTTKELKDQLIALRTKADRMQDGQLREEVRNLEEYIKLATGRARKDPDTLFEHGVRALSTLALGIKGFYIPFLNFSEISSMVVNNNLSGLVRNIPVLKDMFKLSKVMKNEEIESFRHALFGKELTDVLRPSLRNTLDTIKQTTPHEGVFGDLVGATSWGIQEGVARLPHVKWIGQWTNHIIDGATSGFIGDITTEALVKGAKPSKWNTPEFRKAASITDKQYADMLDVIREYAVKSPDGTYRIKDVQAFKKDSRSFNIWRMGDRIAHEAILRPHRHALQDSTAYGAVVNAMLQFKKFTIKSLNARTLNMFYQATKNDRAIEMGLSFLVSMGLASLFYGARVHVQAPAMDDPKAFKEMAFNPKMLAYNAITRSSALAGVGIFNNIGGLFGMDMARNVRTSIIPRSNLKDDYTFKAKSGNELVGDLMGNIGEQIPTLGLAGNVASLGYNAYGYATRNRYTDEQEALKGISEAIKQIVPNDPMTQSALKAIWEAHGK